MKFSTVRSNSKIDFIQFNNTLLVPPEILKLRDERGTVAATDCKFRWNRLFHAP